MSFALPQDIHFDDRLASAEPTSSPAPDSELAGVPIKGEILAGKLLIGDLLGRGGMGVVVAGEHLQLRQQVAIKFLKPSLSKTPEALTRFLREARAAASLRSEHATRIYDVGTTDSGVPYMVMERLTGVSLERRVDEEAPLAVGASVTMVLQACDALAEAHAAGIVHRDVKPANLFYAKRADGSYAVKVLDFGISKSIVAAEEDAMISASLTAPHTLLGSPRYMSPEQVRDARSVDPRSDIWALGVLLYELLTAHAPFESDSIPQLYALILASEPSPMRTHCASLPAPLDDIVLRCLDKDPNRRFQDIAALVRALRPFADLAEAPPTTRLPRPRTVAISALVLGALAAVTATASLASRSAHRSAPLPARALAESAEPAATATAARREATADAQIDAGEALLAVPPPSAMATPPQAPKRSAPVAPRVRDIRTIKLIE